MPAKSLLIVTGASDQALAERVRTILADEFSVTVVNGAPEPEAQGPKGLVLLLWSAALETEARERGRALEAPALVSLWSEERLIVARRDTSPLPLGTRDLPALARSASAEEIAHAVQVVTSAPKDRAVSGAVLFADLTGIDDLYEAAGTNEVYAEVGRCVAALREEAERARGRVLKTIGAELMCVFPDAAAAARSAVAMQRRIAAMPAIAGKHVSVRIGFSFSQRLLLQGDGDVFGDSVNVASRIANMAKQGQILASEDAVARLDAGLRSLARQSTAIKSNPPIEVFELTWQERDAARPEPDSAFLFVSYAHQDRERVDPVVAEIELLGRNVWLDSRNLTGETGWAGQIVRALRDSKAVVLMASPRSYASDQVVRELYVAMSSKKPIIPLEVEPAEIPDELQYILAPFQRHRLGGGEMREQLSRAFSSI